MLGLDNKSLMFPKLTYIRDGVIVTPSQAKFASNPPPTDPQQIKLSKTLSKATTKPVRLYRLDFTRMEEIKQQRQWDRINWLVKEGNLPNEPRAALKSIPESYAATMNSLVFAIPDTYMKAINHCTMMAQTEWEHPYPFDTIIREGCYEPAAAFVKVAFHLLADCIYDENRKGFNRDWSVKQVFEQTALVRYWMHQVGSWVAMESAGFKISHGNGPRITNTFVTMPTSSGTTPDAVEVMMLDMLDFYEHIEAATPRAQFPLAEKPAVMPPDGLASTKRSRKK
jgi:hypothetical protein